MDCKAVKSLHPVRCPGPRAASQDIEGMAAHDGAPTRPAGRSGTSTGPALQCATARPASSAAAYLSRSIPSPRRRDPQGARGQPLPLTALTSSRRSPRPPGPLGGSCLPAQALGRSRKPGSSGHGRHDDGLRPVPGARTRACQVTAVHRRLHRPHTVHLGWWSAAHTPRPDPVPIDPTVTVRAARAGFEAVLKAADFRGARGLMPVAPRSCPRKSITPDRFPSPRRGSATRASLCRW